jgi:serine/threonine protein kinase
MSGIPAGAGSLLGKRLGKYEILALLALGGTAEIYLARIGGAAGFEKYVVVKCLHDHLADDQEFVKMFLDEARLAAHLDHSNIVQTMELGEHENRYYMVMEFLAGLSLAMIVRRAGERLPGGILPVPLSLNMLAQACAGLHYAHERQVNGKSLHIVHRDISPQNLVVSFEGVVKVVDFGIAKAEMRETKTRSGTIKGKFAYMSPEQCVATNVDRRTDVFALGVILWELLTGKRLFKKNSPYETYQAVIDCKVDPPSKINHELDPAIDAITMKAISKHKENRYATAEAFGDALLGYLHHRGKGSGGNDVGRFFDVEFVQEIEEHGARMRELISGQEDFSVDTGVKWSEEDEKNARADMTRDLSGKKPPEDSISLSAADLHSLDRPSSGGLSDVIGSFASDPPTGEDGDIPAERTRIEANPLERLKEMNVAAKAQTPAKGTPTVALQPSRQTGPQPTTRQPTGPVPRQPTTPPPRQRLTPPPQPIVQFGVQPIGVHPGQPNAQPNVQPPQANKMPPSGPLPLPAPPTGPAPGTAAANVATQMVQLDAPVPANAPPPTGPPSRPSGFPNFSHLPTMIAEDGLPPDQAGTQLDQQAYPNTPPPGSLSMPNGGRSPGTLPPQNLPSGYPVMNPQLSNAMQRSGDVFPSAPQSYQQHPMPDSGQMLGMASPVGPGYGQQVDWAQAAATPAKAMPKWMLVAIFAGAILGALLITVIIAKIAG